MPARRAQTSRGQQMLENTPPPPKSSSLRRVNWPAPSLSGRERIRNRNSTRPSPPEACKRGPVLRTTSPSPQRRRTVRPAAAVSASSFGQLAFRYRLGSDSRGRQRCPSSRPGEWLIPPRIRAFSVLPRLSSRARPCFCAPFQPSHPTPSRTAPSRARVSRVSSTTLGNPHSAATSSGRTPSFSVSSRPLRANPGDATFSAPLPPAAAPRGWRRLSGPQGGGAIWYPRRKPPPRGSTPPRRPGTSLAD